jgi:hypothetical protein
LRWRAACSTAGMIYAIEPAPPRRSLFEGVLTGSFLALYFSVCLVTWLCGHAVYVATGGFLEPAEPVERALT